MFPCILTLNLQTVAGRQSAWLSIVGLSWMTDTVMPGFHVIFRGFSSPHETGPTPPPA